VIPSIFESLSIPDCIFKKQSNQNTSTVSDNKTIKKILFPPNEEILLVFYLRCSGVYMLCSRDLGGIDCYLRIFYHTSGTIPKYSQTANQQWPNCSLLLFKAWLVDRCPHLQTAGVLVLLWNPRRRVLPERSNPREEN